MQKDKLSAIEEELLAKLRAPTLHPKPQRPLRPLAEPIAKEELISDFGKCELVVDTSPEREEKGMAVYRARGTEIPKLMLEIGRLREETFRTVGEGSGLERDLDAFDPYYDHFIGWDKGKREITGAYRVGRVDEILSTYGPDGLYTNTLFEFKNLLATDFKEGTLEAGRSFVRAEYQRGPTLLVIWMAFGRFIAQSPQYKYMIGPVSISNEFQEASKHLMVSFLMKHFEHEKAKLVRSKNPPTFDTNLTPEELTELVDASLDLSGLQEFVRHAEGNPRAQIPQLIKLYLELGVRFLAFSKDSEFNTIDGLIWLDVRRIPHAIGLRYL
ncbi:MAG: GNAT family N-acetyltransferase, partial [Bdellovibrionales bacterium]